MWQLQNTLIKFLEDYNINFVNLIFIGFTIVIVVFGSLMNLVEAHLPTCIRQSFRYGKHSFKGKTDPIINYLEVPKSWFKHFYVFAFAWSLLALLLMLISFIRKTETMEIVLRFLDLVAGKDRQVEVNSSCAFIATVLLTLQCARRYCETNFLQIFSKGKINLSHYIVGYAHYFGAIVALLSNTAGFVRASTPTFGFSKITFFQFFCVLIFIFAWLQQYKTNMILVNIRKDPKTGKVFRERHFLPSGEFFEFVSSPHMFFEIVMYMCLWGLQMESNTWLYIAIWVLSNQIVNGLLTHQWYKDNFKDYPKQRHAIIPFVL